MKRSMFVACAIMTLILVFTACGSTSTATPPPPQDISLTTVIAMAKANELREIQVDGKTLTVYPKTIATGDADRFVSRIGDDTDIIGLLIDSGVEVGPPSGVEVTLQGVSAEDVRATISAALAQIEAAKEVLVTPTPTAPSAISESITSEVNMDTYTTTSSGLQYKDLIVGTGEEARQGAKAIVHYTGWLMDGTKFDSSVDRGRPFEFVLGRGQVIEGWDEGVGSMSVGGKRELIIPPDLAYGERGAGGVILPGATLKFEVELIALR